MRTIILALLITTLSSCGSMNNDQSLPAIESNYPALEILSKNSLHNGLAVFEIPEESRLSDLNLKVQGYFNGEVFITSPDCGVSGEAFRYKDNEKVHLNMNTLISDFCIFNVILTVDYPSQGETVTYPLKGTIAVFVKKKTPSVYQTHKIWMSQNQKIEIDYEGKAKMFLRGCGGSEDDIDVESKNGKISFKLEDYIDNQIKRTCVLVGALVDESDSRNNLRFRLMLAFYSDVHSTVVIPDVEMDKKKIKIQASSMIGVVSVGKKYNMDHNGKFKYKNGDIVRLISSKGRLLLGIISHGEVVWMP